MQRGLCGGQGGEGAEQGGPGCSRDTCGCGRGCGCGWSPGLLGRGVRSRGARDLGGCRWGGGGHILCRRVWGEKRTLKGAERDRRGHSAGRRAREQVAGRQRDGALAERKPRKREQNSPLVLQGGHGGGGRLLGCPAEVGPEAETTLPLSHKCPSSRNRREPTAILRETPTRQLGTHRALRGQAGRHATPATRETLTTGTPRPCPKGAQLGATLTCWLATMGPASHEALCVHTCCQTHHLHPQRLLTQAWHLHRAEVWDRCHHGVAWCCASGHRTH